MNHPGHGLSCPTPGVLDKIGPSRRQVQDLQTIRRDRSICRPLWCDRPWHAPREVLLIAPRSLSRFVAGDQDALSVGKPAGPVVCLEGASWEAPGLSGTGRVDHQLWGRVDGGERPFPVWREPVGLAFSEDYDGTAIGRPKADPVVQAGGRRLVVEKQHAAIPRKKRIPRRTEPGEIALGASARSQDRDLEPKVVTSHEPASGAGDVVHRSEEHTRQGDPPVPGKIDAIEGKGTPCRGGAEEDLVARLRPRKAVLRLPVAGKHGAPPCPVYEDDRPAVVPLLRVLEEGDPVASG